MSFELVSRTYHRDPFLSPRCPCLLVTYYKGHEFPIQQSIHYLTGYEPGFAANHVISVSDQSLPFILKLPSSNRRLKSILPIAFSTKVEDLFISLIYQFAFEEDLLLTPIHLASLIGLYETEPEIREPKRVKRTQFNFWGTGGSLRARKGKNLISEVKITLPLLIKTHLFLEEKKEEDQEDNRSQTAEGDDFEEIEAI